MLGNPPWEHTELKEKEWFATRNPEIANAKTGAERKRQIAALRVGDPKVFADFTAAQRYHDGISHFLGDSRRYPFCGRGRINYYAVFAEVMRTLLNKTGRTGAVLPTGIATDDTTKFFFQDVVGTKSLASLLDFENKGIFFPEVHSSYKFCLLTAGRGVRPTANAAEFVFFAHAVDELRDPDRRFNLSPEEIALMNPNTHTCPIFRSRKDAELTKAIYRRVPVLIRQARNGEPEQNPWGIKFKQGLFNMTSDSHLFRTREQLEAEQWRLDGNVFRKDGEAYLPLYEAKMANQFDHRAAHIVLSATAQVRQGQSDRLRQAEHQDPEREPIPRYWVARDEVRQRIGERVCLLGFTDVTSATNERSMLSTIIPLAGVGHTMPLIVTSQDKRHEALLNACLNAFCLDYVGRQKLGGLHFTFFIVKQLPTISPSAFGSMAFESNIRKWLPDPLESRVLELIFTSWKLQPFARQCGWDGPPFRWDEERRFFIRCELDAVFFHLYLPADEDGHWRLARKADGCPHDETPEQLEELKRHFPKPRDAVAYIMDAFPIVRRKDEETYGEYRTNRVILEIYDAMQGAIRTGQPYQTLLDPPPGPPVEANGNFASYLDIADDPPPHIHLPRDAVSGSNVALQLPDLGTHFPDQPFRLRLNTGADARVLRVRPVRTSDLAAEDTVVLASPNLQHQGAPVQAAVGRLRVESRTDAADGSTYLLVSVRGDDGMSQARFSEAEWQGLATVGVVMDDTPTEPGDG